MQRASRILGKVKIPKDLVSPEDIARALWRPAVGQKIADRTRVVAVVRSALVVEVEDQIWQRQLNALRYQILDNLNELLAGRLLITELDLRPMPAQRRGPQTAAAARPASPGAAADEADLIQDPMLQRLYRASRKKASA